MILYFKKYMVIGKININKDNIICDYIYKFIQLMNFIDILFFILKPTKFVNSQLKASKLEVELALASGK